MRKWHLCMAKIANSITGQIKSPLQLISQWAFVSLIN